MLLLVLSKFHSFFESVIMSQKLACIFEWAEDIEAGSPYPPRNHTCIMLNG